MQSGNKKGFTLIELLVVIAIIAILSTIGMTQLASARERARDSQRRLDLSQFQHTLTSYYDDFGGLYPLVNGDRSLATVVPDHSKTQSNAATGIFSHGGAFIPSYFQQEVFDPLTGRDGHEYFYSANCDTIDCASATGAKDYVLFTRLEVSGVIYAMNPSGRISDVTDALTTPPTCPGAGSGDAMVACTPPQP